MSTAGQEQLFVQLEEISDGLADDSAKLAGRVADALERLGELCARAVAVREQAQELVVAEVGQGSRRYQLEEQLVAARRAVMSDFAETEKLPDVLRDADWTYLHFAEDPGVKSGSVGLTRARWSSATYDDALWDPWVQTLYQGHGVCRDVTRMFGKAEKLIAEARGAHARFREAIETAGRAVSGMDMTTLSALSFSKRQLQAGEGGRFSRPSPSSVAPFVAFLVTALVGIMLGPDPVPGVICAGTLVTVVLLASVAGLRRGAGIGQLTTLGVGSSLALFTAAYLVAQSADKGSIRINGEEVSSIGDVAFGALTIGLFGGTIGTDLAGAARVIAFIQILLTVGAVVSVVAWGWRRLLDHTARLGASEPGDGRD
jgi:hypothetical protein